MAKNGIGTSRPNPSVGAVVVVDDVIVGEGFTSVYGGNHAEVNAINSVKNKAILSKATLYVTLEPCAHFGKTPPCADLIVKHNIKQVVIGCVDTNSLVAGKGIKRLKNAGCTVIVGVLEQECLAHHKRFFTVQNKNRPFVILKWAETLDGFIAPAFKNEQAPVWITNTFSQQLVHKWRSEEQAILVGTNTVFADNPKLNVRSWFGNNPIRIVLDQQLRIPANANVLDKSVLTIVITGAENKDKIASLESKGSIIFEPIDFSSRVAEQVCDVLQKHQIQSVIIEGGRQTLQTFIDADLWDEARVFTGEVNFKKGVKSPDLGKTKRITQAYTIVQNELKIYTND